MNALRPLIKLEMDITEPRMETEAGYTSTIRIRISSVSPEACSNTASAIEQAVQLVYDFSGRPAVPPH
jgi:hypothetical protein